MISTVRCEPRDNEAFPCATGESTGCSKRLDGDPRSGDGASFRYEKDLVRVLSGSLHQLFSSPGRQLSVLREVAFGSAIADVLVGSVEEHLHERSADAMLPAGLIDSFLVHSIAMRELGVPSIRERLGVPRNSFDRSLRKLHKCGLVASPYSDFALLTDRAVGLLRMDVIAIEAKLTRWKDALEQARSYQDYSDRSYVALDARRVHVTDSMVSEFEKYGVGLIMCRPDEVSILLEASHRVLLTPRRVHSVLRIAASLAESEASTRGEG